MTTWHALGKHFNIFVCNSSKQQNKFKKITSFSSPHPFTCAQTGVIPYKVVHVQISVRRAADARCDVTRWRWNRSKLWLHFKASSLRLEGKVEGLSTCLVSTEWSNSSYHQFKSMWSVKQLQDAAYQGLITFEAIPLTWSQPKRLSSYYGCIRCRNCA